MTSRWLPVILLILLTAREGLARRWDTASHAASHWKAEPSSYSASVKWLQVRKEVIITLCSHDAWATRARAHSQLVLDHTILPYKVF